jgi:hypothetical protein
MSADKRVPARSDAEIRRIAERTKGGIRRSAASSCQHSASGSVLTIYGRKKLIFKVVEDAELDVDAKTEFAKGVVTITCKRV